MVFILSASYVPLELWKHNQALMDAELRMIYFILIYTATVLKAVWYGNTET